MRESFVFGKKNDDKMTHAVKGLDKNIINDLNNGTMDALLLWVTNNNLCLNIDFL